MPGDVGLIAALLTKVFGYAVDADGWAAKRREDQLDDIHQGIQKALADSDYATVDALFNEYRELSRNTAP